MIFEILASIGACSGLISLWVACVNRENAAKNKVACQVKRAESEDSTLSLVSEVMNLEIEKLENAWVDDSQKLIKAIDLELNEVRSDLFSVAKSPNSAKRSLKEKYKDLL